MKLMKIDEIDELDEIKFLKLFFCLTRISDRCLHVYTKTPYRDEF